MEEYIIIAAIGAIVAMDTTVAGQFMISQPIFASTITGYLLGNIESGLYIGLLMQLMWLKQIPAGGSIYLNGNLGSLTAVSVYEICAGNFQFSTEGLQFFVIIYGILTSYIYGFFTQLQRHINLAVIPAARFEILKNHFLRFQIFHLSGVIYTGLGGAFLVVIFVLIGQWIVQSLPSQLFILGNDFFPYGLYAIWGIGIGTVLSMIWLKKAWYYSAAGLIIGLVLIAFI